MHVLEGARAQPSVRGSVSARPGAELSCVCDAGAAGGLGCRRGLPCPLPAGSAAGERVVGSRLLHGLVPLPVAVSRRGPLAGPDSTGSGLNPCPEQARGPGPCSPLLRGHGEAGWGRARVSGGLKRGPLLQRPPGGVSTGCSFLVPSSGWNFLDFSLRDRRGGVGVPGGRPPNVCGSLQAAGPGILLFTRSSRKPSLQQPRKTAVGPGPSRFSSGREDLSSTLRCHLSPGVRASVRPVASASRWFKEVAGRRLVQPLLVRVTDRPRPLTCCSRSREPPPSRRPPRGPSCLPLLCPLASR